MAAWSKFCTDDPQTFRQYRKKCRPDDLTPGIVHSCSVYFRSLRSGHHRLHISVCIIIIIIIIIIITIIIIIIITIIIITYVFQEQLFCFQTNEWGSVTFEVIRDTRTGKVRIFKNTSFRENLWNSLKFVHIKRG